MQAFRSRRFLLSFAAPSKAFMELRSRTKDAKAVRIKQEVIPTSQRSNRTKKRQERAISTTMKQEDESSAVEKKAKMVKKEDVKVKEPPYWKEMMEGIQEMRANIKAEVDDDGCQAFAEESIPPHESRFRLLVGAMLSSQTKDPVTAAAVRRMIDSEHGLTVESVANASEKELAELIYPVGFYKRKAQYLKAAALTLQKRAQESGDEVVDIPNTTEGLISLKGVGPKMAYLVLHLAWGENAGICVDTHVHRISNRLGWVKSWNKKNPKSQDPEKTRAELEEWLPREHWGPINHLLVGFGQTICLPRGPKCDECKINHLCPSAHSSVI